MVDTCFVFMNSRESDTYPCLSLNPRGEIIAPLLARDASSLRDVQIKTKTIVVLSAQAFSLHYLELPKLSDKKARLAIPFALEENVAENVDESHFSFSRSHYSNGCYLVAVCSREYIQGIITKLDNDKVHFDSITLDWFALSEGEAAVLDAYLLVNDPPYFFGALSEALLSFYAKKQRKPSVYSFTDSKPTLCPPHAEETGSSFYLWLAKRLMNQPFLAINQGSFWQTPESKRIKHWYVATLVFGIASLFCFFLSQGIMLYTLKKDLTQTDEQIARLYREFFPNAKQVISPRFRITQWLKSQKQDADEPFWRLLDQLSHVRNAKQIEILQARFQNQTLQIKLIASDFAGLETLEASLQQLAIHVKKSQASSKDGQVIATLELSL